MSVPLQRAGDSAGAGGPVESAAGRARHGDQQSVRGGELRTHPGTVDRGTIHERADRETTGLIIEDEKDLADMYGAYLEDGVDEIAEDLDVEHIQKHR